jgi:hypothetical protein
MASFFIGLVWSQICSPSRRDWPLALYKKSDCSGRRCLIARDGGA